MPSKARVLFRDKLLPDVTSILETHRQVNPRGHGRRALGHLTRGGVALLCASWELYIEEVLIESARFLVKDAASPDFLPNKIKGKITQAAKNDKHEHGALKLCGLGWRDVYVDAARASVEKLNTPKYGNIKDLFSDWLDIDDIAVNWRHPTSSLNDFVRIRGEIAHRGADSRYIQVKQLSEFKSMIDDLVVDTDRTLSDHLMGICHSKSRPWRR